MSLSMLIASVRGEGGRARKPTPLGSQGSCEGMEDGGGGGGGGGETRAIGRNAPEGGGEEDEERRGEGGGERGDRG